MRRMRQKQTFFLISFSTHYRMNAGKTEKTIHTSFFLSGALRNIVHVSLKIAELGSELNSLCRGECVYQICFSKTAIVIYFENFFGYLFRKFLWLFISKIGYLGKSGGTCNRLEKRIHSNPNEPHSISNEIEYF